MTVSKMAKMRRMRTTPGGRRGVGGWVEDEKDAHDLRGEHDDAASELLRLTMAYYGLLWLTTAYYGLLWLTRLTMAYWAYYGLL